MLGSEGFEMDGSTSAGPGFSLKVRRALTENQMRPPAIRGIVTVRLLPGAPSWMAQSAARSLPTAPGEAG